MVIKLPTDIDLEAAQEAFAQRQSGRDLATAPRAEPQASAKALLRGDAGQGGAIPIGLLRLRRHAARAHAKGVSSAARAAHTAEDVARKIGPFTLRLIDEGDVVFVTITGPDGAALPTRLDAFLEAAQQHISLELPQPIGETVQLGLAPSSDFGQDLISILANPATELILT